MSNSLPVSLPGNKGTISSNQVSTISQPSGIALLAASERQKRNGSSSSSASIPRSNISSPRNNQSLRKQNKASRRPKLTEDMADAAGIRTSGRKGQTNITHLMNFTLPPRPQYYSHHSYAGRGLQTSRKTHYSWGYNAADKARYIHANYRFIVDPQGSYEHLISVDDHVDWKDVLQVLVSSKSQSTNCPICLSDPVSPRMAKCGHIFCLPCLIRYMHSTDDANPISEKRVRWKKCPICEDSIYISEARPVRWFVGQEGDPPREEGDVVLRLMKRENDSALALPKESADSATPGHDVPWYCAAEVMDYARIMKGSAEYMQNQYDEEIISIEAQEKEDELLFEEDNQWTQKAISSIREARERVKGIGTPPTGPSLKSLEKRPMLDKAYTLSHLTHIGETNGTTRPSTDINKFSSPASTFYFYQTLRHYYLAPLDIRILKAAFGDYSQFPSAVLARVEHVSTGHIVDDDLRKRTRYLGHLPHGCEVGFLECDWTDIVSAELLQRFSADLDRRRKRNKDKEAREEKERIRAEKEEDDKRWASIRRRRDSTSHEQNATSSIGIPESSSLNLSRLNLGTSASPPWTRTRAGFTSLASPSTSPNGPKTVWGTNIVPLMESPPLTAEKLSSEPENDGWLQDWERDLMQEDEFFAPGRGTVQNEGTNLSSQGGKKKKTKKITLMSTNARRAA